MYVYMIQMIIKSNNQNTKFVTNERIELIYLIILSANVYTYLASFIVVLVIGFVIVSQIFTGYDVQIMDINMNGLSKK